MRAYMPDPKLQLNIHGRQYMFLLNLTLFRQGRSTLQDPPLYPPTVSIISFTEVTKCFYFSLRWLEDRLTWQPGETKEAP